MTEQELIFSLDIGTRTVVGIVGYHDGEKFNISAYEVEEHKERAMYDGQVHDIGLVAQSAGKVKQRLEEKLGVKLKNVAVAAAGRSLKTHKVFLEKNVEKDMEIERDTISCLEIEAIQKAQAEVEGVLHEDGQQYYCVGYAVVNYYLDGSIIANLEGHKAVNSIGIEVLATFLPKIVVDGLYSVVSRIGLEVSSLTLEPIAAMNVTIQSNLRLLNLALVDIGAGTSDIALTKGGTVFAFGMVPVAGDEITEKLAETYLLDFDTAEKVKTELSKKKEIIFNDVLGNSLQYTAEEIIAAIDPALRELARAISDKILEYNGKAPSAVFLVGGGSLIPGIGKHMAEMLQMPPERIGMRSISAMKELEIKDEKLMGPEFITPIGIAVTAFMNKQKDFLNIFVNDKSIKLFNSKSLTVADALILAGVNPRELIGRRGLPLSFTINGKPEVLKGEPSEPARIFVNGVQSSLEKVVSNGDRIVVDPAVDGKNAEAYIRDYSSLLRDKIVYVNDTEMVLSPVITVNGQVESIDYKIQEHDIIEIKNTDTVEELFKRLGQPMEGVTIEINGKPAEPASKIYNGDYIIWHCDSSSDSIDTPPTAEEENSSKSITLVINGKSLIIEQTRDNMMFFDIFNYIDIDTSEIKGIGALKLNGRDANYTDLIKNGDIIEISWEK